jgi:catalase
LSDDSIDSVCTVGEGVRLLSTLGIGGKGRSDAAAETTATHLGDNTAALNIAAIAKHRHWDRADIDGVPA